MALWVHQFQPQLATVQHSLMVAAYLLPQRHNKLKPSMGSVRSHVCTKTDKHKQSTFAHGRGGASGKFAKPHLSRAKFPLATAHKGHPCSDLSKALERSVSQETTLRHGGTWRVARGWVRVTRGWDWTIRPPGCFPSSCGFWKHRFSHAQHGEGDSAHKRLSVRCTGRASNRRPCSVI